MEILKRLWPVVLLCNLMTTALLAEDAYVQAYVTDPFIEMRTGPGTSYPIFFVAEQGEWIEILKSKR